MSVSSKDIEKVLIEKLEAIHVFNNIQGHEILTLSSPDNGIIIPRLYVAYDLPITGIVSTRYLTIYNSHLNLDEDVHDDSDGCGAKFTVLIVSDKFEGKPLLLRHRMVNEALADEMKSIHAFSMKTLTKEQWEKTK